MITLADYFMNREKQYAAELTDELRVNAGIVVARANLLLSRAGLKRGVNSGWRPAAVNAAIERAARNSKHVQCLVHGKPAGAGGNRTLARASRGDTTLVSRPGRSLRQLGSGKAALLSPLTSALLEAVFSIMVRDARPSRSDD